MKKIVIASVAVVALASFAGCMGKGIGKGKGKAVEPIYASTPLYEEPAPIYEEPIYK